MCQVSDQLHAIKMVICYTEPFVSAAVGDLVYSELQLVRGCGSSLSVARFFSLGIVISLHTRYELV